MFFYIVFFRSSPQPVGTKGLYIACKSCVIDIFSKAQLQHSRHTYHEGMGIFMLLQMIWLCLTHIAEIAYAKRSLPPKRQIDRKLMPERWRRDISKHDIVIVLSTVKQFIIRLSISRREHYSHKRHTHFVSERHDVTPHLHPVSGTSSASYAPGSVALCRIIRHILCVIGKSEVEICHSSSP